jgi:hypothetical protein
LEIYILEILPSDWERLDEWLGKRTAAGFPLQVLVVDWNEAPGDDAAVALREKHGLYDR